MRVPIRVRPGAGRTLAGGAYGDGPAPALVVRVAAPAVDGRATEAALLAVADALGVRRGRVRLVAGATARDKVLDVATGTPDEEREVRARLDRLLGK